MRNVVILKEDEKFMHVGFWNGIVFRYNSAWQQIGAL